jgi:hypothetical protein
MFLGAFFTWVWVPEVQYPRDRGNEDNYQQSIASSYEGSVFSVVRDVNHSNGPLTFVERLVLINRTLEDIANNPAEDQIIGIRANIIRLFGGGVRNRKKKAKDLASERFDSHELSQYQATGGNSE